TAAESTTTVSLTIVSGSTIIVSFSFTTSFFSQLVKANAPINAIARNFFIVKFICSKSIVFNSNYQTLKKYFFTNTGSTNKKRNSFTFIENISIFVPMKMNCNTNWWWTQNSQGLGNYF